MQIVKTDKYISQLQTILAYIAQDKFRASVYFKTSLDESVDNLCYFPYKYRQSDYHHSKQMRDMTFKGYTIVYRVDELKEVIEILEIFNQNKAI